MKPTILIVEDHDNVRASLFDWLSTTFLECRFLEAKSGEEAVTFVQAKPPHVVLMDISLRRMNGIDATQCIKAITPNVHVVILTIHEDHEYKANAIAAGASDYVTKWKMQRELIPILTKLLVQPRRNVVHDK